jgi:cytochrome c-type biogenesis protein
VSAGVASVRRISGPLSFGILGAFLGLALIAAREQLYQLQGGVSGIAELLPFGQAYAAGMVAAFNPCGILLVPSLVAYYLGADEAPQSSWLDRAGKAVVFGVTASFGFVVLFGAVGLVFAVSGRFFGSSFAIGGLAIGVGLLLLGGWMLVTDRSLGIASASRAMGWARPTTTPTSVFVFGVAYGVASLACTLPVFLVVVANALSAGGPIRTIAQFVSYATGMGSMLTLVVLAAAFFRGLVVRCIRGALPFMHRTGAAMLVAAGVFIIHYWLGSSRLFG